MIDRDRLLDLLIERHKKNFFVYFPDQEETPFSAAAALRSEFTKRGQFEYVYFASCIQLTKEKWREFVDQAIAAGSLQINWCLKHRSTDITLIVLAESIDENVLLLINGIKYKQTQKAGFYGWSALRIYAIDCTTGKSYCNRQGKRLKNFLDLHIIPSCYDK